MASSRSDPALGFDALRDDLAELATVVLAQVERAVAGWEESDPAVAEVVADTDREVDVRSAALEERILELHRNWSAFAGDLRLLHVGLIAAVALERVGNLAVQIGRLAGSVPPPEDELEPVRRLVAQMGERAVDALAQSVQPEDPLLEGRAAHVDLAVGVGDDLGDRRIGLLPAGDRPLDLRQDDRREFREIVAQRGEVGGRVAP